MQKRHAILYSLFIILLVTCRSYAQNSSAADAQSRLHALFDQEWAFRLKEFPTLATSQGVHTYNDRLPSVSVADAERRAEYWRRCLRELSKIDTDALPAADRINYEIFRFLLENDIAEIEHRDYLMPVNAEGGFYTGFPRIAQRMPLRNLRDFENYLARLRAFPAYSRQYIELMRTGIAEGYTVPRVILQGYETGIEAQLVSEPDSSTFFAPFRQMNRQIAAGDWERLRATARKIISDSLLPAYRRFGRFMETEYLPAARKTIGASDLPGGSVYYEQRVRFFTNLPYTADEVFEIGQREVTRIRKEMEQTMRESGFQGDFPAFLDFLRRNPRFYARSPRELLMHASYLAKKIDGRLPKLFERLPALPYGVAPVPNAIAPKYTGGRYVPGSYENHRAGTYWVNTYKLDSRPLYVLPALTLHEAVPGHHLQISLAQELTDVPAFRKNTYLSSYGEGWALYAEKLGEELGIYETPYEKFGQLTYEMWRACRLVVDVGIHAKGWSRAEAVEFLASHTALSLHEVNTEIDRYIGWPGQALSYKIGELKIRELRGRAEEQLGDDFDIRQFHEVILSRGALPLFLLEAQVERYLQKATDRN